MPTTLIDSAIFGNIFSTDSMRRVWSGETRTQKYLDIESALARAQARLGIIPKEAAEENTCYELTTIPKIYFFLEELALHARD